LSLKLQNGKKAFYGVYDVAETNGGDNRLIFFVSACNKALFNVQKSVLRCFS